MQLTLYSMYSTAVMEIMFTSPMGTEKRSRESSVGIVSCIPPKKRRIGRGRDGKRPFGRRVSETVFCKWTSFFLAIGENGFDFSYAMQ